MRRQQLWGIILTSSSLIITALLLPITINISTGYISSVSPLVDGWIKGHIVWFLLATIIFSLLMVISSGVMNFVDSNGIKFLPIHYSNNERGTTISKISAVADVTNQDVVFIRDNRFSVLRSWKRLAEELIEAYNRYTSLRDKQSRQDTVQIAASLEKLLKYTRRTFVYLSNENTFAEIAKLAYPIALDQRRWKYAAGLTYDVARVYYDHELGKHKDVIFWDWRGEMKICLDKANSNHEFGKYWAKFYNGKRRDSFGVLDEPTNPKDQKLFYEALTYAAKLYDLEGLSTQNDEEAKEYFEKALIRADRTSDKILSSRIRIHIARVTRQLQTQSLAYYTDVLATLDALNPAILDSFQHIDIINLKLTCYHHLGCLVPLDQRKSWYQKQMGLAKEYGMPDFQVLAHKRLAEIAIQQGRDQSAFSQFRSFQIAYAHAKQACDINRNLRDEGVKTVEFDEIIQLTFSIANEIMEIFSKEPL